MQVLTREVKALTESRNRREQKESKKRKEKGKKRM